MLLFDKKHEVIERVEGAGGFLLVRQFHPNADIANFTDNIVIAAVIESKFHQWRGEEEPDGLTVGMSSTDKFKTTRNWTLNNHKFYGFYDKSKIKPEHYKIISPEHFYNKVQQAFVEQADYDESFIANATRILKDSISQLSVIYLLDLDKKNNSDMVAEWQVYTFFYAFIVMDKQNNIVSLIEFGLD